MKQEIISAKYTSEGELISPPEIRYVQSESESERFFRLVNVIETSGFEWNLGTIFPGSQSDVTGSGTHCAFIAGIFDRIIAYRAGSPYEALKLAAQKAGIVE